ncbi:ROK family protein [Romboutsia ilealis]|uniref:ROK family protein n=1 Tax=Romboutsia ilealis TaxID=1115758 RepID=UPI002572F7B2|nr:ROK family protein [Romboutsia ilealis]
MYKIGIDVGGMSIKAGIVVNGEIIQKEVKETNQSGGLDNIIDDITELVNNLLAKCELDINNIDSIGIGFPGVVTNEGRVTCVNIGLENTLIVPKLQELLKGTIVRAGNDANVAALAEYVYGSMKGYNSGVMITLGTGIGGGIVIDGKLITGSNGIGAEIGHTMVATNYYDCNCGNNGCFETFCSATAIIKYAQKLLQEGRNTIIRDMCKNTLENITAKMIFDAYKENDQVAVEIINRFKKYLAMGIGNIVNFIDPGVISIGGGVSNASDIILDGLSEEVKKYLPLKQTKIGNIVIAKFKNDAGIIGASAL